MSLTVITPGGSPQELRGAVTRDILRAVVAAGTYNDFAPAGVAQASRIVIQSSGAVTLNGLAGGVDGRCVTLYVQGGGTLTLADESAGSAAANRFSGVSGVSGIASNVPVALQYDGIAGRWLLDSSASAGGGGAGNFTAAGIAALPAIVPSASSILVGVEGGVLGQFPPVDLNDAGVPVAILRSTTPVVASTIAPTTIFTGTVPAGVLGTNRLLQLQLFGTALNNSGATRTVTLSVSYGGVTIIQIVDPTPFTTGATARAVSVNSIIQATAAAAQTDYLNYLIHAAATYPTPNTAIIRIVTPQTSAVDSAVNQTLAVTVGFDAEPGAATLNWTINSALAVVY